jgi:DNA-binding transcriptional MocR family regulator
MGVETNTAGAGTGPRDGLTERIAGHFAQRIEQRLLLPGSRLPSVRAGAKQQGVSAFTMVAAYDRLQARGLVEARAKQGFFVREQLAPASRPAARAAAPAIGPGPFDALTLMRSLMDSRSGVGPAHGTLPADYFDAALLRQALRAAVAAEADDALLLRYGQPEGDAMLRELLAQRLADLSLAVDPAQQLVTTVGATHALDLVAHTLAQPGDAVLVDDPGWPVEFARLQGAGLRLLPVPRVMNGAAGPDLAVLAQLVQQHRPRLYVTVSVLHNPTGQSLSLQQAHEVLRLTESAGTLIVEDDTYAGFADPLVPRLASLDGLRRTLYVGGFAKLLGAGLRVGFLAGPAALVQRLVARKMVQQLCSSAVNERALAHLLARGGLRRHAERVNTRLAAARTRCQRLAQQHGFRFATPPAGLFGWLDCGVDSESISQALALDGWRLAPEPLFSPTRRPGQHIRVNFAASQEPRFWKALEAARKGLQGSPAL